MQGMVTIVEEAAPAPPRLPLRRVRARLQRAPVARRETSSRRETAILLGLGAVITLTYLLGFVLPYPLLQYYAQPLLDLAKINGATPASANYFAVTWVV